MKVEALLRQATLERVRYAQRELALDAVIQAETRARALANWVPPPYDPFPERRGYFAGVRAGRPRGRKPRRLPARLIFRASA